MAKIIIEIEDTESSGVKVVFKPSCKEMAALENTPRLTAAHNYALAIAVFLADFSRRLKKNFGPSKLITPKDGSRFFQA